MPKADNFVPTDIGPGGPGLLGWNGYERHYLAEGDSWFTLAALPGGNVLQELWLERSSVVINTAYPGDTLSHIVKWKRNRDFVNLLTRPRFAYKWDAILLSAGGNDLIDAASSAAGILKRPATGVTRAEDCIDFANLGKFDRYLIANLESVVELRDTRNSPNKGIPMFLHTYDYPTARPAPALLMNAVGVSGPWLYNAYKRHQIPSGIWQALTEFLIDHMAKTLLDMNLDNVTVIDTRGVMTRAEAGHPGDSGDWLNEIHANMDGRRKLARRWAPYLDRLA